MASTTPAKREFLVVVPDKKGVLAKRNEVRDQHLTNVKPLVEAGTVSVGGALMDAHPADGEAPQMNGSMLVVTAESATEVRELIAKDIYTTHGVWDIDNAQITPVRLLPKELWAKQR
ncbi:hypothetical protein FQN54_009630 [Arachnomyces sp. PD_36]|nr:hypothetical protein FQN54_009630 [Arachnomyces sp. PD_36]